MLKKIKSIIKNKNKKKIVSLTAYSKNTAKILDKYCPFWRDARFELSQLPLASEIS